MTPQAKLRPLGDKNLADRVADEIRAAIEDGRYEPGMRLVERRLAAELGTSHIPIREALAKLADEGLVERLPRRGSRVAGLTAKELEELSTIRILLEGFVAVRVQERLTPEIEAELRGLVDTMADAAKRGNVQRVFAIDQRFHERLWTLADHAMLYELVAQLRGRITAFLRAATVALETKELEQHVEAHRTLVAALASGQAKTAKAEMTRHIETAAARLSRSVVALTDGDT